MRRFEEMEVKAGIFLRPEPGQQHSVIPLMKPITSSPIVKGRRHRPNLSTGGGSKNLWLYLISLNKYLDECAIHRLRAKCSQAHLVQGPLPPSLSWNNVGLLDQTARSVVNWNTLPNSSPERYLRQSFKIIIMLWFLHSIQWMRFPPSPPHLHAQRKYA